MDKNSRSDYAFEVTMLNTLMASLLKTGYEMSSICQYCRAVFIPFKSILNLKLIWSDEELRMI